MYSFSIWPNIRPRNSKEADKNSERPEKYSTEFLPDCYRKLEKRGNLSEVYFCFFFSFSLQWLDTKITKLKKIRTDICSIFLTSEFPPKVYN
jgi:hypothetical protein